MSPLLHLTAAALGALLIATAAIVPILTVPPISALTISATPALA